MLKSPAIIGEVTVDGRLTVTNPVWLSSGKTANQPGEVGASSRRLAQNVTSTGPSMNRGPLLPVAAAQVQKAIEPK